MSKQARQELTAVHVYNTLQAAYEVQPPDMVLLEVSKCGNMRPDNNVYGSFPYSVIWVTCDAVHQATVWSMLHTSFKTVLTVLV